MSEEIYFKPPVCNHLKTERRCKKQKNCSVACLQCLTCGEIIKKFHKAEEPHPEKYLPVDDKIESMWRDRRSELYEEWRDKRRREYEKQEENERKDRQEKYAAYLKSPQWAALRKKVLDRDKNVCQGCGKTCTPFVLEIHHLTYERIFREMLFDLVAVCHTCHDKIHSDK